MATLRFIHRWLGLVLALPLLIQGITGFLLTLEPAFEGLGAGPAVQEASAGAAVKAALAAAPGMRAGRYIPPGWEGDTARVILFPAEGGRGGGLTARIDPATQALVAPPAPQEGVMHWVLRLHQNWLLPELGGRQFAGWLGVGLVTLVLLGIPLWWPSGAWSAGFTVPRQARGAVLQRRLHGAVGGWLMALMLVTGATGIGQGFPQTTRAVLGIEGGRPGGGRGGGTPALPDLDTAIGLARAAVPGAALRTVLLPAGAEPVRIVMGPPGTDGVLTATTVLVDAATGRVLRVQLPEAGTVADKTLRWIHDLHEGSGLGPVWRGMTAVAGVALPVFGVTGFLLWLLKRRNRAQVRQRALAAQAST